MIIQQDFTVSAEMQLVKAVHAPLALRQQHGHITHTFRMQLAIHAFRRRRSKLGRGLAEPWKSENKTAATSSVSAPGPSTRHTVHNARGSSPTATRRTSLTSLNRVKSQLTRRGAEGGAATMLQ